METIKKEEDRGMIGKTEEMKVKVEREEERRDDMETIKKEEEDRMMKERLKR